jgi:flagellar motor switch protein FliG
MAKQQVIDGVAVAAQILSRFPADEQERAVAAIRAEAPAVAQKLTRKIESFKSVGQLKKQQLQTLLHEVPARDLAISMKTADPVMKSLIVENVSETKRQVVEDDFSSLPPMRVSDVEAAQARILRRLEELYPDEVEAQAIKRFKSRLA